MLLGPTGRAETCLNAEQTAARLLSRGDAELARTLVAAISRLEDRSTLPWHLVRGFHLMSHQRQCGLVLHTIRGFLALPLAEQAEAFLTVAPRIRTARRGWADAKPRPIYHSVAAGTSSADSMARIDDDNEGLVPPLVGTHGRCEAEAATVDFLDAVEVALRRLKRSEQRRLHRRLDKGISEGVTPGVLARMLVALPPEEVRSLEAWVVDEGGMSESGAREFFNTLLQVTAAQDAVRDVGERLASGADAVWAGLDVPWKDWLQGQQPHFVDSPRGSAAGSSASTVGGHHSRASRLSVVTRAALTARKLAADAEAYRTGVHPGGLGQRDAQPMDAVSSERSVSFKRTSCQLHCPASAFLWSSTPCVTTAASKTAGSTALGEQFGL